jgi:hypothetical protein
VTAVLELNTELEVTSPDKLKRAVETELLAVWLCVTAKLADDAVAVTACCVAD